ncbi:hypothetical protein BBBOND_0404710 [Babesia bigemina]|uniref:Uncharacterized protein n=1 Tax=Babesia bigemina TaxID=5866 RepID=A0A061DEW4_BABBI|nr:hypothetical protein BBBOND_0404710 [Babesia bigemina]CDR97985.1 hypothetical protein BBBOND_0404710 [Babesia bigemina]|eukprot:XP_012770171.1 hypothetical protein BBBOND_0404710 [Babesia bigemina]
MAVRESALTDPQVAAMYDHVSSGGELYCKRDLECLMRQFDIKPSQHRGKVPIANGHTAAEVVSQLLEEGLLCTQRFKNVIVFWASVPSSRVGGKKVEAPVRSEECDLANLQLRYCTLKEELAKLEATKGASERLASNNRRRH